MYVCVCAYICAFRMVVYRSVLLWIVISEYTWGHNSIEQWTLHKHGSQSRKRCCCASNNNAVGQHRLYLARAHCGSDRCTCAGVPAHAHARNDDRKYSGSPASGRFRNTSRAAWRGVSNLLLYIRPMIQIPFLPWTLYLIDVYICYFNFAAAQRRYIF